MEIENTIVDFRISNGPIRGKDRNRVGLVVRVKARQDVEDFMKNLSFGRTIPVDNYGDSWQNVGDPDARLEAYETDTRFEKQRLYVLDHLACPLLIESNQDGRAQRGAAPSEERVNLSFLKLVGVSSEQGVQVGLLGAYSSEYVKRLRGNLSIALTQFLQDYIVPVTINLQVINKG